MDLGWQGAYIGFQSLRVGGHIKTSEITIIHFDQGMSPADGANGFACRILRKKNATRVRAFGAIPLLLLVIETVTQYLFSVINLLFVYVCMVLCWSFLL